MFMRAFRGSCAAYATATLVIIFGTVCFVFGASKTPSETVKEVGLRVEAILNDNTLTLGIKEERIRDTALPYFDTREMARRALGMYWGPNRSRGEEFTALFIQLIQKSYLHGANLSQAAGSRIAYLPEQIDPKGFATVPTLLSTRKIKNIPVTYRLHYKNGTWQIYDVLIEGNSLIGNYRAQFYRILSQGTFDDLLIQMKKSIAESGSR